MKLPLAEGKFWFQLLTVICFLYKTANVSLAVTNWLVLNEPCARVCGVKPALHGAN